MQVARALITPRHVLVATLSLLLFFALIATLTSPTQAVEIVEVPAPSLDTTTVATEVKIRVEISGGVAQPGVISLPDGSRLIDAVSAAGGWGERVDPLRVELCLNLAAPLEDGGAIRIPTRDDRLLLGLTGVECGPLSHLAQRLHHLMGRAALVEVAQLGGRLT